MIPVKFAISGEHYLKALDAWKEITGESSKNIEILQRELPVAIRKLHEHRPLKHAFNVLSVGSGDGANDLEVLQIVQAELQRDDKNRDVKIFNRAIEPNPNHTCLYEKAIENMPDMLRDNTTFDVRNQTFEEYKQEEDSEDLMRIKFDIVHFIHSIYYLDVEATLKHSLEKELRNDGKIVIVAGSFVTSTISNSGNSTSSTNASIDPKSKKAAEVVQEIAHKYGWKLEKYSQEYSIDLSEVFDEYSVKGNLILDLIAHKRHLRASGDRVKLEQVLKSVQNQTTLKDGRHLGKKVDDILIVSK